MSYARQIATAKDMLTRKGSSCVWHAANVVTAPGQPWLEVSALPADFTTVVVILPFDEHARRQFGYAQGNVPAGTVQAFVPGSEDFVPSLRDTVTVGATTYDVVNFDKLNPDSDKDILYVMELRS